MEQNQFTGFYRTYMKRVYAFVYFRVGGDRRLAEDLTQDIFLKAYEAFERYDPSISQASWIYTIARNHIINTYAKTHPGTPLEEVEWTLALSYNGSEVQAQNDSERRILEVMQTLPPEEVRLIRMKYLEGWSFDELAQITGKTSGALRVQAIRLLQKLRGLIERKHIL
ncbi:MAG: sigma-70 family RNA polymerase sigma factor [Patescibacteria group bacterium]